MQGEEKVLNEPEAMASARLVSTIHNAFETEVVSGKRGGQTPPCTVETRILPEKAKS